MDADAAMTTLDPSLDQVDRESREAIARARLLVAEHHAVRIREERLLRMAATLAERLAERGGFEPPVEL